VNRRVAAVLGAGIALALGAATGPGSAHGCVTGDEYRFRAADGTRLAGHRFGGMMPKGRTAVVLAHMSGGDLCQWAPYARNLASKGFFVFPFDFRGHGFSQGGQDYAKAPADLVAAIRAVRRLGARRVVVVGASLGGIAALVAAPTIRPPLAGVAAVSAPAEIVGELNAVPAAGRLRLPTLYVAAGQDQNPPYDFAADGQKLYDATTTPEKRLELVPGSLHGVFLVAGSTRVRTLLQRFIRDPGRSLP
jgi:alpha-beta hydrolase superfamily lysophospholipase